MPVVVPAGPVALPPYLLRRMLALSPTFQQFTKSASFEQSFTYTHMKELDGTEPRPCGVINHGTSTFRKIAGGSQPVVRPSGSVSLYLALDTPEEFFEDEQGAFLNYCNFHGGVANDIAELSGQDQTFDLVYPDSHLEITEISEAYPPLDSPRATWNSIGRFWWSVWIFSWGDQ